MVIYVLKITKNMGAVDYNDRLRVSRELETAILKYGKRHGSVRAAVQAAEEISRSPLVVDVRMTRVKEKVMGTWRGGSRDCLS
jgi:hypothetical protein